MHMEITLINRPHLWSSPVPTRNRHCMSMTKLKITHGKSLTYISRYLNTLNKLLHAMCRISLCPSKNLFSHLVFNFNQVKNKHISAKLPFYPICSVKFRQCSGKENYTSFRKPKKKKKQ